VYLNAFAVKLLANLVTNFAHSWSC